MNQIVLAITAIVPVCLLMNQIVPVCRISEQIEKELHTWLLVDGIEMVFVSGEGLMQISARILFLILCCTYTHR